MTDEIYNYGITKIFNGWIIKETIGLKNRTMFFIDMYDVCKYLKGETEI